MANGKDIFKQNTWKCILSKLKIYVNMPVSQILGQEKKNIPDLNTDPLKLWHLN